MSTLYSILPLEPNLKEFWWKKSGKDWNSTRINDKQYSKLKRWLGIHAEKWPPDTHSKSEVWVK